MEARAKAAAEKKEEEEEEQVKNSYQLCTMNYEPLHAYVPC